MRDEKRVKTLKIHISPMGGALGPHIWGGEPWATYLQNDPKLERFRDFGTPLLSTPTTITSVKCRFLNKNLAALKTVLLVPLGHWFLASHVVK